MAAVNTYGVGTPELQTHALLEQPEGSGGTREAGLARCSSALRRLLRVKRRKAPWSLEAEDWQELRHFAANNP